MVPVSFVFKSLALNPFPSALISKSTVPNNFLLPVSSARFKLVADIFPEYFGA